MKICSQVKAEIQNVGREVIMSILDSITSLIQMAKNLMNAVVKTMKMSYIALVKIVQNQSPLGLGTQLWCQEWRPWKKKIPWLKERSQRKFMQLFRLGSTKKTIHIEFGGKHIYWNNSSTLAPFFFFFWSSQFLNLLSRRELPLVPLLQSPG